MHQSGRPETTPLDATTARPNRRAMTPFDLLAVALSLAWIAIVGLFLLSQPRGDAAGVDPVRFVFTVMAVFLPVAMIWVAAAAARSSRIMREESARLQAAIDALRRTYVEDRQSRGAQGVDGARVERKLNEIAQATRKTETAVASLSAGRPAMPAAPHMPAGPQPRDVVETRGEPSQPSLAIGSGAEDAEPPIPRERFVRAMNFPQSEADQDGFDALREALRNRHARQLIQASQDVLTLLSQDGIYMEDLTHDRAPAEVWRRFARGARGRQVAELGGLGDRSSLALATGRMRQDAIFRDAVHHFLRRFDQALGDFEQAASDDDILALADTRTGRAFMLLGRATGIFDPGAGRS